jgi:DNA-binding NarL/FixJ family response regulator
MGTVAGIAAPLDRRRSRVTRTGGTIAVAFDVVERVLRTRLVDLVADERDLHVTDVQHAHVVVATANRRSDSAPSPTLIVLREELPPDAIRAGFGDGVAGYLGPHDDLTLLPVAIRAVHAGSAWLSVASLRALLADSPAIDCGADGDAGALTAREHAVLQLIAKGATQIEVARELFISPHTVRTHLRNAIRKLGAHSRVEAVAVALGAGIITLSS